MLGYTLTPEDVAVAPTGIIVDYVIRHARGKFQNRVDGTFRQDDRYNDPGLTKAIANGPYLRQISHAYTLALFDFLLHDAVWRPASETFPGLDREVSQMLDQQFGLIRDFITADGSGAAAAATAEFVDPANAQVSLISAYVDRLLDDKAVRAEVRHAVEQQRLAFFAVRPNTADVHACAPAFGNMYDLLLFTNAVLGTIGTLCPGHTVDYPSVGGGGGDKGRGNAEAVELFEAIVAHADSRAAGSRSDRIDAKINMDRLTKIAEDKKARKKREKEDRERERREREEEEKMAGSESDSVNVPF